MITDTIAATHLGKKSDGCESYNPSLLVAIPRSENRNQYNINNTDLPFGGYDIWNCYEFSCLTENGIPVTRLLKLKYPCESEFLIESKSLKLYLNSFNMTRFGKTAKDCLDICKKTIEKDLNKKLNTTVEICFFDNNKNTTRLFNKYKNIMKLVNERNVHIKDFKENQNLLTTEDTVDAKSYYLTFDSLRSNCRITHQPDFGDIFIYYKSRKHITEESLVKYLVSFRSEYHFHEECCEMIYKRLHDLLDTNDELIVCALYTRRGGIDISPVRFSKNCTNQDFEPLTDINTLAKYGVKQ